MPAVAAARSTNCRARTRRQRRFDPTHPRDNLIAGLQKGSDEHVARPLIDVVGTADLLDQAVLHYHDPIGERQRLSLVTGDASGARTTQPLR
jgi:hypothetical protein